MSLKKITNTNQNLAILFTILVLVIVVVLMNTFAPNAKSLPRNFDECVKRGGDVITLESFLPITYCIFSVASKVEPELFSECLNSGGRVNREFVEGLSGAVC